MTRKPTATVLIIEDEADLRRFAARVLELEGYRVTQAADTEEGLRMLRESRPSLVLLDLILPKGNGWQILEALAISPAHGRVPVVVFSASAGEAQRKRAIEMGATAYLVKPVSASDLIRVVGHTLEPGRKPA